MTESTDNAAPAQEAAPESAVETTETQETQSIERPEWLPEKFKTAEDLVSSYKSLEQKLGKGQEELKEQLAEEIKSSLYEGRPENSDSYTIPDGTDEDFLAEAQGFLDWWSKKAWDMGLDQESFEEGIKNFGNLVEPVDMEAEAAKLGDNAQARIDAVGLWATKNVPEEYASEIVRLGETAEGVMLIEHFMNMVSDTNISPDTQPAQSISESDLQTMMNDPRYWNPAKRDPAFVKEVDEGYKKIYK